LGPHRPEERWHSPDESANAIFSTLPRRVQTVPHRRGVQSGPCLPRASACPPVSRLRSQASKRPPKPQNSGRLRSQTRRQPKQPPNSGRLRSQTRRQPKQPPNSGRLRSQTRRQSNHRIRVVSDHKRADSPSNHRIRVVSDHKRPDDPNNPGCAHRPRPYARAVPTSLTLYTACTPCTAATSHGAWDVDVSHRRCNEARSGMQDLSLRLPRIWPTPPSSRRSPAHR
jgi:hypothetical protein